MKMLVAEAVLVVLIIIGIVLSCNRTINYDEVELSDQLVHEKIYLSYEEMKEDSDIIAIIKINDELTNKNSTLSYYESGYVKDFWSSRDAEVVKVYKNSLGKQFAGNVAVMEHIGISDRGLCYKARLDEPMLMDNEYLVFIKVDDDGTFRLISQESGKHNTDGSRASSNILLNLMLDYELTEESDLAEEIKTLSIGTSLCFYSITDYYPDEMIKTNAGDITVSKAVVPEAEKYYYYEVSSNGVFNFSCIFTNMN